MNWIPQKSPIGRTEAAYTALWSAGASSLRHTFQGNGISVPYGQSHGPCLSSARQRTHAQCIIPRVV